MTSSSISFKKVLPAERYLRASANEPAINDAELTGLRAAIARAEKAEAENAVFLKLLDSIQKSHFSLSRDNAALRTDKKRLDWLEKSHYLVDFNGDEYDPMWHCTNGDNSQLRCTIRAAIDAAKKEASK